MSYNRYRWCAVADCKNTSTKTPEKLFIKVPNDIRMRNKWLKLGRRNPKLLSIKSTLYFCEDHFNLADDMANYMEYKIMKSVKRIQMKPNCTPSKFGTQPDRKHNKLASEFTSSNPRSAFIKEQRISLIEEESSTLKQKACIRTSCNSAPKYSCDCCGCALMH